MALLTVEMVSEAIRKNGVQQVIGAYVTGLDDEHPEGACALGQAYLNLREEKGLKILFPMDAMEHPINSPSYIRDFLSSDNGSYSWYKCSHCTYTTYLGSMVVHLNDNEHLSFAAIADYIDNRAQYKVRYNE